MKIYLNLKKKFMSLKIGIGLMEITLTQNLTQILKNKKMLKT